MKYTEQEFKFDHIFDFVRYLFSSIFLAPFRFTNELTRKLPYLQQELLSEFNIWAIGINAFLIVTKIVSCVKNKNFNPFSGTIPLVAYILSGGVLCLVYFYLQTWVQPTFRRVTEEEKQMERIKHKRVISDLEGSAVSENEDLINDETLETIDVTNIAENIKNNFVTTGDKEIDEEFIELESAFNELELLEDDEKEIIDSFVENLPKEQEDIEFDNEVQSAIACDKYGLDSIEEELVSSEDASINIDDVPNLDTSFTGLDTIDLSSLNSEDSDVFDNNLDLDFSGFDI